MPAVCLFIKVRLAEVYRHATDCECNLGLLRAVSMIALLSGRCNLNEMFFAPESVGGICRDDASCFTLAVGVVTLYDSRLNFAKILIAPERVAFMCWDDTSCFA